MTLSRLYSSGWRKNIEVEMDNLPSKIRIRKIKDEEVKKIFGVKKALERPL